MTHCPVCDLEATGPTGDGRCPRCGSGGGPDADAAMTAAEHERWGVALLEKSAWLAEGGDHESAKVARRAALLAYLAESRVRLSETPEQAAARLAGSFAIDEVLP